MTGYRNRKEHRNNEISGIRNRRSPFFEKPFQPDEEIMSWPAYERSQYGAWLLNNCPDFHPVIRIGEHYRVLDLTRGYNPDSISLDPPSIGRYNEKRMNMYSTPQYQGERNIHMGLDIWVPSGTPVYAFSEGQVIGCRDNNAPEDYGPTIITEHKLSDRVRSGILSIYALFGHLSRNSLEHVQEGMLLKRGQAFATVGNKQENGGWVPHLHFQLSWIRPAEPDMPGVVSSQNHSDALLTYPDPQLVLGRLY
ncbi:MAG: peptidoglycan DD-metalloendopeptidase family protein [Balneolales bacterium]